MLSAIIISNSNVILLIFKINLTIFYIKSSVVKRYEESI